MLQSYLPQNYFWHNYFKARDIVNLMQNAFGSAILNLAARVTNEFPINTIANVFCQT